MSTGGKYSGDNVLIAEDASRTRRGTGVAVIAGNNTITYSTPFPTGYTDQTIFIKYYIGSTRTTEKVHSSVSETGFVYNAIQAGTIDYVAVI